MAHLLTVSTGSYGARWLSAWLVLWLLSGFVYAQQPPATTPPPTAPQPSTSPIADTTLAPATDSRACVAPLRRPCVALVLGGGGARGSAHIGVLRAIEEYQIPVDLVVGTSIGAFVGGLYASGKNSQEIQQLFETANWNAGYRDNLNRSQIPNRRKRQLDDFPIHLDLGVGHNGILLPQGFVRGQSMKALVDNMLGTFPVFASFDQLPVPFRAVAADAVTGEQVVLDAGDLATALQISMSLPGVVRPVERDGRMLVDGGIANNLPVSVARDLGADIIIAVDIGSPSATQEQLVSGIAILRQLTSFLTRINVDQAKALLGDNDLLLIPHIEGVTLLSFDKTLEAITAGHTEARQKFSQSPALQRLANTTGPAADSERPPLHVDSILINRIVLNNQTRLADSFILHRLGLREGTAYTPEQIHNAIDRLYGQGTIARINTTVRTSDNHNTLVVDVQEKEWGPGYMNFKLSFEDNFKSFSHYQLGASYRLTNLSPYGAEWYTTFEIGTEKNFTSEIYWPLYNSGFYLSYQAQFKREIYDPGEDSLFSGQLIATDLGSEYTLGWATTDIFDIQLGLIHTEGTIEISKALSDLLGFDELDYEQYGGALAFSLDTLDDASFPRSGWKWNTRVARTLDTIRDSESHATAVDSQLNGVASLGRHSLRGQLRYQSTYNDEPETLLGNWALGGFLNLSGNPKDSILGQHVRFASLVYTYQLAANDFGALTLPLYLGLSLEAGNAWQHESEADLDDLIHSASAFIGWDSPLGPAYLAYGRSDTNQKSLYMYLGFLF